MTFLTFAKKRVVRLYPMFLVGSLLGIVALLLKYHEHQTSFSMAQIIEASLLNLAYLPFFNHQTFWRFSESLTGHVFPINEPAWSLFFEVCANAAFVFTIRLSKPVLISLTLVFGVWLAIVAAGVSPPGWKAASFMGGFPRVGYTFMIGVLIYQFFEQSKGMINGNVVLLSITLIALMMIPGYNLVHNYWLLCTLFVIPLIVWLGTRTDVSNTMAAKWLHYIGWLSYPLYCLHIPIAQLVSVYFPAPHYFLRFSLLLIFLILLVSDVVGRFYDEPVRAKLSQLKLFK